MCSRSRKKIKIKIKRPAVVFQIEKKNQNK